MLFVDILYQYTLPLPLLQLYKEDNMKNCLQCDNEFKPVGREMCCSIKCNLLQYSIKDNNGCWFYKKDTCGAYSKITVKKKYYLGHRLSYQVFIGEIEEGKWICHKCDEPKCINPDHLFMGSPSDNAVDAFKKKRRLAGQSHHWTKFSDIQIKEMRELHKKGISYSKLTGIFNCCLTTVASIITNKYRKD